MGGRQSFSFNEAVSKIRSVEIGKEAAMYGPLRDLFISTFGYPASDVDIDTSGEGGRPDVTVKAPSGLVDRNGNPIKIAWIVVEAKDERGVFADPDSRERIFGAKSKYIGTNTGWFVMVDPTVFVARQVGGRSYGTDIVITFDETLDEQAFRTSFALIRADIAGVPEQLKRFRQGDEELIASEKLVSPDSASASTGEVYRYRVARKRFYSTLRESTQHLQDACRYALQSAKAQIQSFVDLAKTFSAKYGGEDAVTFDSGTMMLTGRPQGPEAARAHEKDARALRKAFLKAPHIARLALEGLPAFQSRTGADDEKLDELFAVETANLILARILLLRFFEDHGFFGERRYICNGGVEAFQNMREYFAVGYTHLLEQAYKQASRLYAAAFDETELDWVFGSEDTGLSTAIEWTLFQFARYDFTTIKGDVLTGIYDRFLDREKRKELGEFYTPPSIARYIVRRVGIRPGDKVFDPACGSGTFLIEAYRELIGNDVERGIADYEDVARTLLNLSGNDLNTFSAVLCQIQLLWHILRFKNDIQREGFPDLPIASKVNSLIIPDHFSVLERFGELDVPEYSAVIGNPPYVRKERSAQDLDRRSAEEFARGRPGFKGISPSLNAYALFIYRALNSWCRPANGSVPGRLGFIVPVSLFDANETEELRSLFRIRARWTILEVIDLEVIYRRVFDADVLPAIIICENRPAQEDDKISVRIATKECVKGGEEGAMPDFDFDSLPEETIPYADVFSPDGRVLTRLTDRRARVLRKLWQLSNLRQAAKPYWVKRTKGHVEWRDSPMPDDPRWEERRMISRGIVFRSTKPRAGAKATGRHDIYKGENIIAAELQGEASLRGFDPRESDAAYLWQYENILPERAYAIAQVAHCPNAVAFNPHEIAFTDTATVFVPDGSAAEVPFDLLLMSDVYVWFYAFGARMGILRTLRSHIYPTNFGVLPYSEELSQAAATIESFRVPLVSTSKDAANASAAVLRALEELHLATLKARMKQDKATRIEFGENFDVSGYEAEITSPHVAGEDGVSMRLDISDDLLDWVELNRRDLAEGLLRALRVHEGVQLGRTAILGLGIPISKAEVEVWDAVLDQYSPNAVIDAQRAVLHDLNSVVARALGLTAEELTFIERECSDDSFVKKIKPRYPGSITRKQGFRTGLDASSRYGK